VAGYIFAGLPIPGSDTGDYLVRNLIGIDPEEKLLAIGDRFEESIAENRRQDAAYR
jgi:small ligand-binding sensory domain FIST